MPASALTLGFGYTNNAAIKNVGVVDSGISGGNYVGGVCGHNYSGEISNCNSAGKVTASADAWVGSVCGYNGGTITNCYYCKYPIWAHHQSSYISI